MWSTVPGEFQQTDIGEVKINRSVDVNFFAPGYATKLKLVALDLSGPGVVEVQISASCLKNSDLHDSLNKVETNRTKPVSFTHKLDRSTMHYIFCPVCTSILQVFFFK